jgi:hypothetical protein
MPDIDRSQLIIKACISQKARVDEAERSVVHFITTDAVDREKEVVLPDGLDFSEFRQNSIVPWAHQYDKPAVAKSLWVRREDNGWLAKTVFAPTPRGEECWQLAKGEFCKAWSIGFIADKSLSGSPTQKELSEHPAWKSADRIHRKAKVIEYSFCNVGMNPEALTRALEAKTLHLSPEFALELGIDQPKVQPPAKVYSVLSARTLKSAFLDKKNLKRLGKELAEDLDERIPKAVKEAVRLAKGGV